MTVSFGFLLFNTIDAARVLSHDLIFITAKMMNYVMLVSRQGKFRARSHPCTTDYHIPPGKVRLAKWFQTLPPKAKAKIVKDVTQLVLARRTRMCNVLEYKGTLRGVL
jgi:hypothetical protein